MTNVSTLGAIGSGESRPTRHSALFEAKYPALREIFPGASFSTRFGRLTIFCREEVKRDQFEQLKKNFPGPEYFYLTQNNMITSIAVFKRDVF